VINPVVFLHLTVCNVFLSSLTVCNISLFTRSKSCKKIRPTDPHLFAAPHFKTFQVFKKYYLESRSIETS
jgi:hypothetical protein